MMSGWRIQRMEQATRRGAWRRGFFVPFAKCQARVLECQAPVLEFVRWILSCRGSR
jgi:hypothetical protein